MTGASRTTGLLLALGAIGLLAAFSPAGCATGDDENATSHGQEDCLNGADDDEDGTVDCGDPSCSGFTCADAVPEGWTDLGHVVLSEWPSGAAEPDCPAEYPDAVLSGVVDPVVPEAACSPCGCGMASGNCELPDLAPAQNDLQAIKISSRKCDDPALPTISLLTVPPAWDGACFSPNAYPGGATSCVPGPCNVSVKTGAPIVTAAGCEVTGGEPAPVAWSTSAKLCGGGKAGGGCSGSSACLAKPGADFESGPCIATEGQATCPSPYTTEVRVYDPAELVPGTCSACSCDAPPGLTCAGTVTVYSDTVGTSCTTVVASFPAGGCADLEGNPTVAGRVFEVTEAPGGGACTPAAGGGVPTGPAALGVPTTVCCLPP